jgi:hypothetical protein
MVAKKHLAGLLISCLIIVFIAGSCKKKKAFKEEDGQDTVDARMTQGQNDEAIKDANIAVMESALLRGKGTGVTGSSTTEICGATIDTFSLLQGSIKINYDGKLCYGMKKTGSIIVTIEKYPLDKWKYAGCKMRIDFVAYKVTRSSDGKSVQLDGTEYLTNLSGDTWFELRYLNAPKLVQTLEGENIKVTFSGGDIAIYNFSRKMTYTISNEIVRCKVEGTGSVNGNSNLENWGQNRDGDNFTTEITTPVVWSTICGPVAPIEGEVVVKVDKKDFDLKCKFAVDKEGNETAGDNPCPYGYKLSWSYKKKTKTRIFGYY